MSKENKISGIKLIFGLGNPGKQYELNRHNIGHLVIDALSDYFFAQWSSTDVCEYANVQRPADLTQSALAPEFFLVKSRTFMNDSGKVMAHFAKKGIKPEEVLVIHDELEKTFGTLAIRQGGSARGHNGLRSIIALFGADFWRLRIGIGRPERKEQVSAYVLSNFAQDEQEQLESIIEQAVQLVTTPGT